MNQNQHQNPADGPTNSPAAPPGFPGASCCVVPVAYSVGAEGGGMVVVNGVPQPLSRRSSRALVAAIVFATCVLPLLILATVYFMTPDFGLLFSTQDLAHTTP